MDGVTKEVGKAHDRLLLKFKKGLLQNTLKNVTENKLF